MIDNPPETCPHCKKSHKPIAQAIKPTMHHEYSVGDKVRVVNKEHILYGDKGEIVKLMPYMFLTPAYDVRINGMVVAISERSLEKLQPSPEIDDSLST